MSWRRPAELISTDSISDNQIEPGAASTSLPDFFESPSIRMCKTHILRHPACKQGHVTTWVTEEHALAIYCPFQETIYESYDLLKHGEMCSECVKQEGKMQALQVAMDEAVHGRRRNGHIRLADPEEFFDQSILRILEPAHLGLPKKIGVRWLQGKKKGEAGASGKAEVAEVGMARFHGQDEPDDTILASSQEIEEFVEEYFGGHNAAGAEVAKEHISDGWVEL